MMLQQFRVIRLLPGIAIEVLMGSELQGIYEYGGDHTIRLGSRSLDQRHVAGVQCAHGRDQRDYFTCIAPRPKGGNQIA